MKKFLHCLLLMSFLTNYATYTLASSDKAELEQYVKQLISDGYTLFNNNKLSPEEKNKGIMRLLNDTLNLDWMAKYSLGRHRRTLDKNKIDIFTKVYSKFVVKAYVDLTQNYKGQKARLKSINKIDDDMFIVHLEIINPVSDEPIAVDYLVQKIASGKAYKFKVADIITEGISLLNSQQSEFNTVISNQGIDVLIKNLEEATLKKSVY